MAMVAIAAFTFSGCSNEDIQIDKSLTVTINPANVVAPFTFEVFPGDLTNFDYQYTLRTRLLIYNEVGKRVSITERHLNDYKDIMNVQPNLPNGTYTMVAITDIISKDGTTEYWTLSDGDGHDLSKLQVTTVKKMQGENEIINQGYKKNILGTQVKRVTINKDTESINMEPTAAGALICVHFKGITKFSDVKVLQFNTNQLPDYLAFDTSKGDFIASSRSFGSKLQGVYINFIPSDGDVEFVDYVFMLPTDAIMAFAYREDDDQVHLVGYKDKSDSKKYLNADLTRGKEYEVLLDLNSMSDISTGKSFSIRAIN